MKRLKLKAKPKRLRLVSTKSKTTESKEYDIESILEQYHNNVEENKKLPYFKWISFIHHLPLDNNDPILVYEPKWNRLYDSKSLIALQHYLWSRYNKYNNTPTHWMRLKLPKGITCLK